MWRGLWAQGRGNKAEEEQHLLGLKGLVEGYGKKCVCSEFPTFHNTPKVLSFFTTVKFFCGEGRVRTVL